MAHHNTGIGPISAAIHVEGQQIDAQIVAFGWDDKTPTEITGFWYFSPQARDGLAFISKDHVISISA
jgi:hypothetical protein